MESSPQIRIHQERFALVRLVSDDPVPGWIGGKLWSAIRSPSGVSVFCESQLAPDSAVHSKEWCCLELLRATAGNVDAHLSAIASSLRSVKADLFVVSAVEADYFFVRAVEIGLVLGVLSRDGYLLVDR
jgi:hypothetical protein